MDVADGESQKTCILVVNIRNLSWEGISNRPESINAREEAGHHEVGLVVGARGGKKVLLVINERVARYQHIILTKDKTQRSVIRAINHQERKLGKDAFLTLFNSITFDKGVKFQDFKRIEKSVLARRNAARCILRILIPRLNEAVARMQTDSSDASLLKEVCLMI